MIRGIAAFDLDGTLLRGDTVCEVLAKALGRLDEMKRFETFRTETDLAAARAEMAAWFRGRTVDDLQSELRSARWAPGAREAIQRLQQANIVVAIASITWDFAVRWFAERLGVRHHLGTGLSTTGEITHVWGRDKALWLAGLVAAYGTSPLHTAAVGDSPGDAEMLRAAALRFFVGTSPPPEVMPVVHLPGADLRCVADRIMDAWAA
jgi:phosphoserine phosphatase